MPFLRGSSNTIYTPQDVEQLNIISDILEKNSTKNQFGWWQVRTFGELHLLTKATYLTLLLVPILAGLWPSINILVNSYNQTIENSVQQLDIASTRLGLIIKDDGVLTMKDPKVHEITTKLNEGISDLENEIAYIQIKNSNLPSVWVLAFLASLSTLIAHTLYQLYCPEIIQRCSEKEYIYQVLDEHKKLNPNQGLEENANSSSASIKGLVAKESKNYHTISKSNPAFSFISQSFYFLAAVILIVIIAQQTTNILRAGGWIH